MKRSFMYSGIVASVLALGSASSAWAQRDDGGRDRPAVGGGDAKALEVGKEGLKMEGKVGDDDPKVGIFAGDKEIIKLPAKSYSVQLSEGKKYTISMDAANQMELDAFLIVHSKDGKQLGLDDDGGGGLNSKLVFTAPKSDTYKIPSLAPAR